jgi:hypothetical protein
MRKIWTSTEIGYLKEKYPAGTEEEITAFLGRNWHSIKLKCFKLGISRLRQYPPELLTDYAVGMSLVDLQEKYQIPFTTLYRHLKENGVETKRQMTDFGDDEEFKKNYISLSEEELVARYGCSWVNIKTKASNLDVKRPTSFLDRPSMTEKRKKTNLARYGCEIASRHVDIKLKSRQTMIDHYGHPFPTGCYGKAQNNLQEWLNSLGFNFKSNHTILGGKEIDLYDGALASGIEYCGLFWHNEKSLKPKERDYHVGKLILANNRGVRLITIFEDEWLLRESQCKNFLKATFGKNTVRLFARKCKLRILPRHVGQQFIAQHHIQGSNHLGVHFAGLYNQDELVGVMSFGRHHRNVDQLTLDRLCFKEDTTVVGGASRLFHFLLQTTQAKALVSWSDNRWSEGNVYTQLGFVKDADLGPDYSYVFKANPQERFSKQSQKKSACGCPGGKTELEWATERGLARIWDCGKIRWKYIAPSV